MSKIKDILVQFESSEITIEEAEKLINEVISNCSDYCGCGSDYLDEEFYVPLNPYKTTRYKLVQKPEDDGC